MQILADANILIRAFGFDVEARRISNNAVRKLTDRGDELVVVPQLFFEWWVVATRPKGANGLGIDVRTAETILTSLESSFPILLDDELLYLEWRRIVTHFRVSGKAAHDARLVAAMMSMRSTIF
jgi:hypothetical protein